jgi:protein-S-isoprenylcysteine O-methyltransferase Ste14
MTPRLAALGALLLALAGLALVAWAWLTLASARRRGVLAVRGPYGLVRHPQYLGWLVAALGLLVWWPRLEGFVPLGILAATLTLVARGEEAGLEGELGCVWKAYAFGRPAFVPRLSRVREALAARPTQATDQKGRVELGGAAGAASREKARS